MIWFLSLITVLALLYSIFAYRFGYNNGHYDGTSEALSFDRAVRDPVVRRL